MMEKVVVSGKLLYLQVKRNCDNQGKRELDKIIFGN